MKLAKHCHWCTQRGACRQQGTCLGEIRDTCKRISAGGPAMSNFEQRAWVWGTLAACGAILLAGVFL